MAGAHDRSTSSTLHRPCRRLVWCETTTTQPTENWNNVVWVSNRATALRNPSELWTWGQTSDNQRQWCPIGRRAEHASTRLQNDTNVLLPPLAIKKGSTATWSWRHRQPRRRICALTTRLLQRSARRAAVYVTIAPLQRVINAAVRLVYGLHPRDHVLAAAIELHWLPIEYRIQYKICLLVHLSLNGKAPSYISSLIQPVFTLSTRPTVLRSASNLRTYFAAIETHVRRASLQDSSPQSLEHSHSMFTKPAIHKPLNVN